MEQRFKTTGQNIDLLDLQDIASFLNVHPNTISKIRRDITFDGR